MFVFSKQVFKQIVMSSLTEHILELCGPNLLPDVGPAKRVESQVHEMQCSP